MIKFFETQGPWALLFVVLFFWTLREHKRREEGYVAVINRLNDEIVPDLRTIKEAVLKKTV